MLKVHEIKRIDIIEKSSIFLNFNLIPGIRRGDGVFMGYFMGYPMGSNGIPRDHGANFSLIK